jgi:predicted transcriptional regulator
MEISPKKGRDSLAIVEEVLRMASTERVKRTSMLYEVGMSYEMMTRYLKFMIGTNLLEEIPHGKRVHYQTSDKGKQFLRLYHEMTALLTPGENTGQTGLRRTPLLPANTPRNPRAR